MTGDTLAHDSGRLLAGRPFSLMRSGRNGGEYEFCDDMWN
jgi:hypothetical protein